MDRSRILSFADRLIKSGFIALFGLTPLLLTPINYELFEYNKMMAVYLFTAGIVAGWAVKSVVRGSFSLPKTPLDVPIAVFVASQFVSAVFSIDPHVSWFGYYSRFNGGMWSVISYVLLYYAFLANRELFATKDSHKHLITLLRILLVTGTLVATYGVLERLGIDKNLWVQDVQNRVFSTLGQPNWLAAYLVAAIPLTFAFGFESPVYFLVSILFFLVLLFTRSRSGLLGAGVADILFWAVIFGKSLRTPKTLLKLRDARIAGMLHLLFAAVIVVNGTGIAGVDAWLTLRGWSERLNARSAANSEASASASAAAAGPALEVGGTESGTIRKYVWQGAVNAWKSSAKTLAIGTGTETFAFAFYRFRPVAHNETSEWDFLYNKAHNEYLNYLTTTGAFGLGSYLFFLAAFAVWCIRKCRAHSQDPVIIALFAGWISILVTNFFGFSVVILQVFLFLFPAMAFLFTESHLKNREIPIRVPDWTIWALTVVGIVTAARIMSFWYADTLYASGYRLIRAGLSGQAIPALTTAIAINRAEPVYHDEISSAYAALAVASFEGGNATQAAELASLAIRESNTAIAISPENVNFYKSKTKIYYTLSSIEPSFNTKAIDVLKQSLPLSPNDPKIPYNLAILVGREGDSDAAIRYLNTAISLKKGYRDAYYALWVFYTDLKKPDKAKQIIETYLTAVNPNDKDFRELIK